ncbi:oligosaccharide flippase family protein [Aliarcobacter cryaerophilus]|uniref:oligosaccharide flippase family protein n=1 Tax=Aliarcobacter cryaerophilus TaxID=28198 RepID=UPI00164BD7B6|nr:oligosaccharide flippase family protein [Aliarcobacter cryaerophilus]QNK84312.1 oligosaccharide flippase family protein [Aliarcobacter cryaerophilus]
MKKNLISSYITKGILLILNFIYIALFIKLLGVENYGLFTVSLSIVNLFLFFNTGVGLAVIKYFNDKNFDSQKVYETLISLSLFIIVLFSILQFLFSSYLLEENNEELKTISYIITIFALMFALGILSSLLHAKENIHEANIVEVFFNFSKLIIGSLFIVFFSLDGAYMGMIVSLTISILHLIYYMKKFVEVDLKRFFYIDLILLKDMIRFIWFNSLNEGIWRVFSNLDKILISKLFGNETLGYYNIAYTIVLRLWDFPDAISRVVYPRFTKIKDNFIELNKVYKQMSLLNISISLFVNSMVFIFAYDLITLWLNEKVAQNSYWMLQILIIGNILGTDNWVTTKVMLAWSNVNIMFRHNIASLSLYFLSLVSFYFILEDVRAFLISFIVYYTSYMILNRKFVMINIGRNL